MHVGRLALGALQRFLTQGSRMELQEQHAHEGWAGPRTACEPEETGASSRRVTEEVSGMSCEASVLHRTPQRVRPDMRMWATVRGIASPHL